MRFAVAILAAVLLAASPAHAEPQWLAPVDVAAGGEVGTHGDVAVAPDGTATIAYTVLRQGINRIEARVRPPGQAVGPVIPLSAAGNLGTDPTVATDAQGNVTAAWTERIGGNWVIRVARRPAGVGAFEGFQTVSGTTTGDAPALAVGANGTAVVAFMQGDILEAAVRSTAGGAFAAADEFLFPGSDFSPVAAVDDNGKIVVAWSRDTGGNQAVVEAAFRPPGGPWDPGLFQVNYPGDSSDTDPVLAISPNGRAVLLWTHADVNGSTVGPTRIDNTELRPDNTWRPGFPQQASPLGVTARRPAVAIGPDGTAVGAWVVAAPGGPIVQAALRPPDLEFRDHRPLASTDASRVAVAANRAGAAVIGWSGLFGDGVFTALRTAGGGLDPTLRTAALGTASGANPSRRVYLEAIGVDDAGNAAAVWMRETGTTFPLPTQTQDLVTGEFDGAPPTFGSVSVPAEAVPGQALAMSAAGSDRHSVPAIAWSFGDGAGAQGPAVSHAYAAAGAYTVTVTATDGVGNTTSATRSILVTAPPSPPVPSPPLRVNSRVATLWGFDREKRFIFLLRMKIRRPVPGARAALICDGRKCPFERRARSRVRGGVIDLLKELKQPERRFHPGTALEVRITAPGYVGKVVRYKLRRGKIPDGRTLCLPPGAKKPRRRC